MKRNRLALEAVVVGVLLVATILLGLDRATGQTAVRTAMSPPDTTTVERLTRAYDPTGSSIIQVTTDVTGTNTAVLTAGLLLDYPYYLVSLPLVNK